MSRRGTEEKPPWSAVPREIKERASAILGRPIVRAERVYGGYAPSATFRLLLANGKRAFFKASYPLPEGSGTVWTVAQEARNYQRLGRLIQPWAPRYFGDFARDGWHVLLLEDVGPRSVPPWTLGRTRAAARSYARFHKKTIGKPLPRWLSRKPYLQHSRFWRQLSRSGELAGTASLAGSGTDEAREWIDVALPTFIAQERVLERARRPYALLHFDTRSDNVRLHRGRLRIFDWPYASAGAAEFDVVAFCQAVAAEGGPEPERVLRWYEEVQPLRRPLVDASLAGITGYFADRSWRPPIPGLPRLRPWQRAQLKACVRWAALRFALPEPRWLEAVPD